MNIPGGHPPPKFWRFLALGAVNWRSCFWLDFLGAILQKNQRGRRFSCLNALKNKALPLHGHFAFKMVHVGSQTKDSPTFTKKDFAVKCTRTDILTDQTPKPLWTPQEAVHQRNFDDFDLGSSELEKLSSLKIRRDFWIPWEPRASTVPPVVFVEDIQDPFNST